MTDVTITLCNRCTFDGTNLHDDTLAGTDLAPTTAISPLMDQVGISLLGALRAAATDPASLIGSAVTDVTIEGRQLSELLRISNGLSSVLFLDSIPSPPPSSRLI
ncbi:hypothetical protein [Aliiroseovarius sp. S253]|uniref:hypothetical protein n=1 Tax=Aliiroseovarius sp. S253 TaxID=3415133 RepID=UPI003C7E7DF2